MFTAESLKRRLPSSLADVAITTYDAITSTNKVAADKLVKTPGRLWLVADHQTAGVGRHGKGFFSPAHTGLYMTYGGFTTTPATLSLITPAAGVALQQAVQSVLGVTTAIKWVNDVLLDDKKVAGILAERLGNGQVLVGIGINVAPSTTRPDVPIDLPVGSLLSALPTKACREALAAAWLVTFDHLLAAPATIMPQYRQHAAWLHRTVTLSGLHTPQSGTIAGFGDDGALLLKTVEGIQAFTSGSIRLA
ncbi:biotin--[acetyl-CoA-carboxylase] ligase [Lacticaseibacillus sp. GG6-2]